MNFIIKTVFEVGTGQALAAVAKLESAWLSLGAAQAKARTGAIAGVIPTATRSTSPAAALAPMLVRPAIPISAQAPSYSVAEPILRAKPTGPGLAAIAADATAATGAARQTATTLAAIAPALPTGTGSLAAIGTQATAATGAAQATAAGLAAIAPALPTGTGSLAAIGTEATAATGAARQTATTLAAIAPALPTGTGSLAAIGTGATAATGAVRRIEPPLNNAAAAARSLGRDGTQAMSRLGGAASGLQSRLMGIAGAYVGIQAAKSLIGGAVTQQVNLETRTIAASAMINANVTFDGKHDFGRSMGLAKQQLNELSIRARDLPGTFEDYSTIYGAIAGPLLAGGEQVDALVAKSADVGVMAKIIGQNAGDASNQVTRMLTGQAGADNPFAMYLKNTGLLKTDFETLNRMPLKERIKETFAAIGTVSRDPRTLAAIAKSADTQFSTLKDNLTGINGVMGIAGKTIAVELVAGAKRLNDWFSKNPAKVQGIADMITGAVVPALKLGERLILSALNNAQALRDAFLAAAAAAAMIKVAQFLPGPRLKTMEEGGSILNALPGAQVAANLKGLGDRAFGLGRRALSPILTPTAARGAATAAAALVPAAGTAAAAPLAAGLGTAAATIVSPLVAGAVGPLAGAFPALSAAIAPVVTALPPVAIGLAIVAGVVAAVAGVIFVVKENLFGLGDMLGKSTGALGASVRRLGSQLWAAFKLIAVPLGAVLVPIIAKLADGLTWAIDLVTNSLDELAKATAPILIPLFRMIPMLTELADLKGKYGTVAGSAAFAVKHPDLWGEVAALRKGSNNVASLSDLVSKIGKQDERTRKERQQHMDASVGAKSVGMGGGNTFNNTFNLKGNMSPRQLSYEIAEVWASQGRRGPTASSQGTH